MEMNTSLYVANSAKAGSRVIVLFLLTLALAGICGAIFFPFLSAITWAVALAVATRTPYDSLLRRTRNPTVTAILGILLVIVLILVPAFFLVQSLGDRLSQVFSLIQGGAAQTWFQDTIDKYPRLGHLIEQALGTVNLQQVAQSTAGFLAARLRDLLTGSAAVITQAVVMLFALFFLFRDRNGAVRALRSLVPLNDRQTDILLVRLTDVLTATLQGRVIIAALQGSLGGLMFWFLGVPEVLMWTVMMILLAMIPLVGTFPVWMSVAVYLALTDHWVRAIVLVGWGILVIGTVDNLLYPTLVGSKLQLHTAPLFFSVLGGIAVFGASGIVLGPLVLTAFAALLRIWKGEGPSQGQPETQPGSQKP
jgi:predicted PurR-regulated permease PerM